MEQRRAASNVNQPFSVLFAINKKCRNIDYYDFSCFETFIEFNFLP
jgi:hypothetical protein